jgi:Protein of unknown function (DUF1353)
MMRFSGGRVMSKLALSFFLATIVSGCASLPVYEDLQAGSFKGSVIVVWVGEGGPNGDGQFVYVPDPQNPLTFTRPASTRPASTTPGSGATVPVRIIVPEMMYTDGGSIPKFAQAFQGLSPWGYAPAYMIHDWLFTAHYCLKDGLASPAHKKLENVSLKESAQILGEAIKALVEQKKVAQNDAAAGVITAAVASNFAEKIWEQEGNCEKVRVKKAHADEARAAVSPRPFIVAHDVSYRSSIPQTSRGPFSDRFAGRLRQSPNSALFRQGLGVRPSTSPKIVSRVTF